MQGSPLGHPAGPAAARTVVQASPLGHPAGPAAARTVVQGSPRGQPLAPTGCPRPAWVPTSGLQEAAQPHRSPASPRPHPGRQGASSRRSGPTLGPQSPGENKHTHTHTHTTQPSASFLAARPVVRTAGKGRGGRRRPHQGHAEPPLPQPGPQHPGLTHILVGAGHVGCSAETKAPGPSLGRGAGQRPPAATPGGGHAEAGSLHLRRPPPPRSTGWLPSPHPGSAAGHPASHRLVRKEASPHSPDQGPQPLLTVILEKIRLRSPPVSASRPSPTPSRRPNLPHTGLSAQRPSPSSGCGPPPLSAPALALSVDTVIRSPCIFLPGTPPPGSPPHTC